ncbi:MAG TPA: 50S ribosomal protein L11 methyltransferase [Candidatus Bathyarchaeia archaeon]|jgi:protein arginine N-methyltransferase 1|nr:50S ribosomal protein L11 methyltransferase [Candidatus Bathyarchaeia archaeon]
MYSLGAYGSMIADRVRVDAYVEALRKTVRKGSVVVEIGTGPGVFAVLACQLGASKVYAIEPAEIIQVAREVAAANSCAEKIEFFEQLSRRATLPTRADVMLSDLRGVLPFFQRHIPAIVDARQRFLGPGGSMIPRKDTLWAAIVEAPKPYGGIVDPWDKNPFGQDLGLARVLAVNDGQKARVSPEQLLTTPKLWATLDYSTVESPDVRGKLEWAGERGGTGHGIAVWFDTELAEGVGFSNAPGTTETVYGSYFFPWAHPVPLQKGQSVCVHLQAKLVENDYVWRWTTRIEPLVGSGASPIHYEQSQLAGAVLSPKQLRKLAADYIPNLSEEGILRHRTFELMDGKLSLKEIAHQLAKEFPLRFSDWRQALSFAGTISREFSQ